MYKNQNVIAKLTVAAIAIGIAVLFTIWKGETLAIPAIATIAAVIGETVRPKLVIICIGKIKVMTSTFKNAAILGVNAANEKNAALPDPIKKAANAKMALITIIIAEIGRAHV